MMELLEAWYEGRRESKDANALKLSYVARIEVSSRWVAASREYATARDNHGDREHYRTVTDEADRFGNSSVGDFRAKIFEFAAYDLLLRSVDGTINPPDAHYHEKGKKNWGPDLVGDLIAVSCKCGVQYPGAYTIQKTDWLLNNSTPKDNHIIACGYVSEEMEWALVQALFPHKILKELLCEMRKKSARKLKWGLELERGDSPIPEHYKTPSVLDGIRGSLDLSA